jgi:endo-1,4-beta-D-glucanase Y
MRRGLLLAGVLVAALAVSAVAVAARRADAPAPQAAAEHFLDVYVRPDGRVVRIDQGGDTVSEGQAYGMLLAAGIGDEARFRAIWAWTAAHLQRPDHLLAWRWVGGRVVDSTPAADADLVAAGALALAGQRFGDRSLVAAAGAIGAAVLAGETVTVGPARALVAGPWAAAGLVVNPSYFAVALMSRLVEVTGDHRWAPVAASSRRMLDRLTATAPSLIPDWAMSSADLTSATSRPAPGSASVVSGFEAGRAYVELAVDCARAGQAIAARAWPFFAGQANATIEAVYHLDGSPATAATHPLALVAAAATGAAAGDAGAADRLLDRATALDRRQPTYYGAAWVAIARLWLDTPALGGCRPGAPTR